jgi:cell wall-associated NlpC family hydrolase
MRRLIFTFSVAILTSLVCSVAAVSVGAQQSQEARGDSWKMPDEKTGEVTPSLESVEDPYFSLVDDGMDERFRAEGWRDRGADEETYGKSYAEPSGDAGPATFRAKIPTDGLYTVYARWPQAETNTTAARFSVPTTSGRKLEDVDQRNEGGGWIIVGAYKMEKGKRAIRLSKAASARGRAVADAVMVVRDAVAGENGHLASTADPDALAPQTETQTEETELSTRAISNPTRSDIVRISRRHKGTPYGHTRCRNDVQEDCSCHTALVYRKFDYKLPDSPVYQWRAKVGGIRVYRPRDLVLGDLVFHDLNQDGALDDHYADHVEIYAGNGYVIHASSYFGAVVEKKMKYLPGFWGGRRLAIR